MTVVCNTYIENIQINIIDNNSTFGSFEAYRC